MAVMNLKLLIIQGKPAGKHLALTRDKYYIGRGPECDIRLDSELVSRQHCLLRVTDEAIILRDLASRNGTLVNGKLVEGELALESGDQVQIGTLVLQVEYDGGSTAPETVNRGAAPTAQIEPKPTDVREGEAAPQVEMTEEGPESP